MYEPAGVFLKPYTGNPNPFFPAVEYNVHSPFPKFYRKPGQGGGRFAIRPCLGQRGAEIPFIKGLLDRFPAQAEDQKLGFPGRQGVENRNSPFSPADRAGIFPGQGGIGNTGTESFGFRKKQNTGFQ
jgi:hypothetical protein